VAFIAAGGLCLGWSLANYHMFIEWVSLSVKEPVVVQQMPATAVDSNANETLIVEENIVEQIPEKIIEPNSSSSNITQKQGIQPITLPAEPSAGSVEVPQISEPDVPIPVIQEPAVQVSPDLLKRFQKAISEVEFEPAPDSAAQEPNAGYSNDRDASSNEGASSNQQVARIDQLPAWVMTRLPSMSFSAHMYASEESERWVRVNGTRMMEGDLIDSEVEIVRIEAQHVILSYSGQEFSMAALTDW
jgi:general secretion pathway protein B